MRIIAVDPGKMTGLCSFNVQDNETLPIWGIDHWQLEHIGVGQWFDQWRSQNKLTPEDTKVVAEAFIITPSTGKKSQAPWSLETLGVVRYFVETAGLELLLYSPSSHKSLVSDSVLKAGGLWFPGENHACDAARVGLYHVITKEKLMRWALKGDEDG